MAVLRTAGELLAAKNNGELPVDFMLVLENDDVHAYVEQDGKPVCRFRSDPHTLLRELLDYVGLPHDEA